jgi:hypothetical protein
MKLKLQILVANFKFLFSGFVANTFFPEIYIFIIIIRWII